MERRRFDARAFREGRSSPILKQEASQGESGDGLPHSPTGSPLPFFSGSIDAFAKDPKSASGVSLYSRFVNRPFGRILAVLAVRAGVSANGVTAISAGLTAAAIVLMACFRGSVPLGIAVSALLVLGFALDSADGQVARISGTSSAAGEWLDHIVDAAKMVAVHAGVLIGWYRFASMDVTWLILPLGYQFVAVVTFSALTIVTLLKRQQPTRATLAPSTTRAFALLPADYGILAWSFLVWGNQDIFRVAYLVLFVLNGVLLVVFLVKWFAELQAGDHAPRL